MTRWLIKNSRHYSQDPLIKKAIRVIYLVCRLLHTSPPKDDFFFVLGMVLQVVFEWKGVGVLMVPGQNERLQKLAIWRSRIALQNKICMRIVRPAMTVCLSVRLSAFEYEALQSVVMTRVWLLAQSRRPLETDTSVMNNDNNLPWSQ